MTDSQSANEAENEYPGAMYFDFDMNKDDSQGEKGNTYPGLRSQLSKLRESLSNTLFSDLVEDADIFEKFVEYFFTNGRPLSYFACNVSLKADNPNLMLRPAEIRPLLFQVLPKGMTLAIQGRLRENIKNVNNPVFRVQKIVSMSHSDARPFEKIIQGLVYSKKAEFFREEQRKNNLFTEEFVSALPLISVNTRDKVQEWRSYLDWMQTLIHVKLDGLRYIHRELVKDNLIRFLTVCESEASFKRLQSILRSNEMFVYELGYSKNPWVFENDETSRAHRSEVGHIVGKPQVISSESVGTQETPWDNPYFCYVAYDFPDDIKNELADLQDDSDAYEEASNQFLLGIPEQGFLSLSIVGDIILLKRQRIELERLQQESGYAPFLSSYLFDISQASPPHQVLEIPDDRWSQPNLNTAQRQAVKKMINAPDLCLIQGPPGTGKTTMIAEAAWQFVCQHKKVLLVSQASLAVNNVLERLPQEPVIRAIRLSNRERRNEREHPYSRSHALSTYYHSIASACKQTHMDSWELSDVKLRTLRKWYSDFRLIASDLDRLHKNETVLVRNYNQVNAAYTDLQEKHRLELQEKERRSNYKNFYLFLQDEQPYEGVLPENLLNTFYDTVIQAVDTLVDYGLRINTSWMSRNYGSIRFRTSQAVEVLNNWRKMHEFVDHIGGDLKRLHALEGNSTLSLEETLHLNRLQEEKASLAEKMETDGSVLPQWQALIKEIHAIERSPSGLDRSVYERYLTVADNPILSIIRDARSSKRDVIKQLQKLHDAFLLVERDIHRGKDFISHKLDSCWKAISISEVNQQEMKKLERNTTILATDLEDVVLTKRNKEERIRTLLTERDASSQVWDLSPTILQGVGEEVQLEIQVLEQEAKDTEGFRNEWGEILKQWVENLSNEETIQRDTEKSLDHYIHACNIVGVTCTEDRRTLEDYKHTWFDVVIVDEVSKATPTEIIMPLMLAKTAILVGDHRQLPPLFREHEGSYAEVLADKEEAGEGAQDSLAELNLENFQRYKKLVTSSLFKEHFENAPDEIKSTLFIQYRMHPDIMAIVNKFYENRLECGLGDYDGKQASSDIREHRIHGLTLTGENSVKYIIPDRHVAWLDSSVDPYGKDHYEYREQGTSKANELESILIAKTLYDIEMSCREQGYGSNNRPKKEVGVITFYNRQVRSIRDAIHRLEQLEQIQFRSIAYDVNTVDRYQGQERPIILVSMVRNPPHKLSRKANTAQYERINVAFSRAQELLIIYGAKNTFKNYPVLLPSFDSKDEQEILVYKLIQEEIQRKGGLKRSEDIISQQLFTKLLPDAKKVKTMLSPKQKRGGKS